MDQSEDTPAEPLEVPQSPAGTDGNHSDDEEVDPRIYASYLIQQVEDAREQDMPARSILSQLGMEVAEEFDDLELEDQWAFVKQVLGQIVREILSPARKKLEGIDTIDHALELIQKSNNILVLTGAGISVSVGIPDFRSENGIYSMLGEYSLPNPQAMFEINFFKQNPVPFFKFAKEIFPGTRYQPSPCHRFIKAIEDQGKLLRNYTQNIDTLEVVAGIENVIQCHGSFSTARCTSCRRQVPGESIKEDIMNQVIPKCGECGDENGVMKPDIVFFGEAMPTAFDNAIREDREKVDLVLVMGSSLKVAPVADIVRMVPAGVPVVLINREVVGKPNNFDVELLGNCDDITRHLWSALGWPGAASGPPVWTEVATFCPPNRYLFEGSIPSAAVYRSIVGNNSGEVEKPDGGERCASPDRQPSTANENIGAETQSQL